jgi:hypothetical protein
MPKDVRVYCKRCAQDVRDAGYILKRTDNVYKSECDKCMRQGYEYVLKRRVESWQRKNTS